MLSKGMLKGTRSSATPCWLPVPFGIPADAQAAGAAGNVPIPAMAGEGKAGEEMRIVHKVEKWACGFFSREPGDIVGDGHG